MKRGGSLLFAAAMVWSATGVVFAESTTGSQGRVLSAPLSVPGGVAPIDAQTAIGIARGFVDRELMAAPRDAGGIVVERGSVVTDDVPAGDPSDIGLAAPPAFDVDAAGADDVLGPDLGRRAGPAARNARPASPPPPGDFRLSSVVPSSHNGATTLYLQQQVDGIDVIGAIVNVAVSSDGDVVAAAESEVVVGSAATTRTGGVDGAAEAEQLIESADSTPAIGVLGAAALAAEALGWTPAAPFSVLSGPSGTDRSSTLSGGGVSAAPIPARLVYERTDELRLAWELTFDAASIGEWWRIRIDAETGDELSRFSLFAHHNDRTGTPTATSDDLRVDDVAIDGVAVDGVAESQDAHVALGERVARPGAAPLAAPPGFVDDDSSYLVFASPVESPIHGPQTLVTEPADDIASPFGWHDTDGVSGPESTLTVGNNVDAGTDLDNDNVIDVGSRVDGGASLDFVTPFDPVLTPLQKPYQDAAVVNLFYWNNVTHDFLYAYGFDEAAGNFQMNNYGRGGLGGDPVEAQALDGYNEGTRNNANFATPPDGRVPRMQMYAFDETDPERASSFDAGVVAHEYAHGLSTRLTGGPAYDECLSNDEQQGEGWSDIIALLMTMQGDDAADRVRGIGTYVLGDPIDGLGIRDQRYATDMLTNTWTYDTIVGTGSSPHRLGAVWAQMLWEMTWLLIDRYGFDPDLARGSGGNNVATQLIVDGLKLQPCRPGFVDSRNAILQADAINNAGANTCLIWEAFAKRGLGVGASQGSSNSRTDGVEDFSVPASCDITLAVAAPDEVGPGDVIVYELTARNDTGSDVSDAVIVAPIPADTTYVSDSATCDGGGIGVESGGAIQFSLGTLSAGTSRVCGFEVTASTATFGRRLLDDVFPGTLGNWVPRRDDALGVDADWGIFTFDDGFQVASASVTAAVSDQYLEMSGPIVPGDRTVLTVQHSFDLDRFTNQLGADGGVIEISVDDGPWVDLGPQMTRNAYNRMVASDQGSPIAGRPAYSGSEASSLLIGTDIDLSPFAGDSVRVRFRLASDATGAAGGYWDVYRVLITDAEVRVSMNTTLTYAGGSFAAEASTRVQGSAAMTPSTSTPPTSTSTPPTTPPTSTPSTPPPTTPPPVSLGEAFDSIVPTRLVDTRANGVTIDGEEQGEGRLTGDSQIEVAIAGRSGIPADAVGVIVNVTAVGPQSNGFVTVHPCRTPRPVTSTLNVTAGVNLGNEVVATLSGEGTLCVFASTGMDLVVDAVGYLPAVSVLEPIGPARLLDTRPDAAVGAMEQIEVPVVGRFGVASGTEAVVVNVTAVRPSGTGFVTVHPCLIEVPTTSSLNVVAGVTRGNEIVTRLDDDGKLCLLASTETHITIDIVGALPPGSELTALAPARLLDTRATGTTIDGVAEATGRVASGEEIVVRIAGRAGVPVDATAVSINITAVRPQARGFVTVYPCGAAVPNASSLNVEAGVNGGNDLIAGLDPDGDLCVVTSTPTDLTIDVTAAIT
ncbi:MAG: M36 family metallopeptidase [Ilumatobacter sp.]|uniref:M36 family metallopeptidase n=1 Tax=Ilumatobacter sp. TaxID=1967498 RepID=UPI003918B2CB